MRYAKAITAAAAVAVVTVSACGGSSGSSVGGCERALAREVSAALASGSTASPAVPQQCKGLSPADQRRAAQKVADGLQLGG